MSDYAVLGDLLVIYAVSTAVVFLFHQFRLPSIAGFLVAGALIGPHGLHLIPDVSQVQVLAEIGIVLLLFTIGMEFSSAHFAAARRILMVASGSNRGGPDLSHARSAGRGTLVSTGNFLGISPVAQ